MTKPKTQGNWGKRWEVLVQYLLDTPAGCCRASEHLIGIASPRALRPDQLECVA